MVWDACFYVALDDAFAEVFCPGGVACLPFVVFAHVNQSRVRVIGKMFSGLFNRDLAYAALCIVNHFQESGGVFHGLLSTPYVQIWKFAASDDNAFSLQMNRKKEGKS